LPEGLEINRSWTEVERGKRWCAMIGMAFCNSDGTLRRRTYDERGRIFRKAHGYV
jgi:hypothetical protein